MTGAIAAALALARAAVRSGAALERA